MAKTDVFRVVFNDGTRNRTSLVFDKPEEGKSYQAEELFVLGRDWAPTNDEGDIPHREPSGEDGEDLGITWHFQK